MSHPKLFSHLFIKFVNIIYYILNKINEKTKRKMSSIFTQAKL